VFLVAAALAGGCVTIPGLGRESLQGDIRILELLTSMGCRVERSDSGDATVHAPADGRIRPLDADLRDTPDLAPPLAVAAAFADGVTRLRGIGQLRLKESDRIGALAQGLSRLSAEVEIHDDGLTIHAAAHPTPAIIASFGDHRIAMSFALAATRLDGIVIRGATCVDKSFPDFWPTWRAATNT
jgi:3-phosphoshikimate 1-carboxyvinyltransferase